MIPRRCHYLGPVLARVATVERNFVSIVTRLARVNCAIAADSITGC
jgi:hypothetical protein